MVENIAILGSTGSIGVNALEVAKNLNISVSVLAAHSNISVLEGQIREFRPDVVCVFDEAAAVSLRENVKDTFTKVMSGEEGLCTVAAHKSTDMVLNAVVGVAGLLPTMMAIDCGKNIALANKESLVAGGDFVMRRARENGVTIIPVDSEHSAIFQSMGGDFKTQHIKKLILTASGGPFFGKSVSELKTVTKDQALRHPNWSMGAKISIDSATMMNKGLEIIEAAWLFGVNADKIDVLIHRESIIHSMVEYEDNSIIAQLGHADMKLPIQYALTWPERCKSLSHSLDFAEIAKLTFYSPDTDAFKAMNICREALKRGGLYPAVINGANEEAVRLFLESKISFFDITNIVERAFESYKGGELCSFEDILSADRYARDFVLNNMGELT